MKTMNWKDIRTKDKSPARAARVAAAVNTAWLAMAAKELRSG